MALVNQAKREINAKIVFFGPGLSGKATNLKHIYNRLKPDYRGVLKAMNVQEGRMLFFDFTPPGEGNVDGYRVRFHVYTVSGSVVDPAAWKMVLKGVDGVVFVADAEPQRRADNRDSLDHLGAYLKGYGQSLSSIPVVFQYNKVDLVEGQDTAELERMLNPNRFPSFKANSQSGEGVLQTVLSLVKTVLGSLRGKGLESAANPESLQNMMEPAVAAPAQPVSRPAQPAPAVERPAPQPAPEAPTFQAPPAVEPPRAEAPQAPTPEPLTAPETPPAQSAAPQVQAQQPAPPQPEPAFTPAAQEVPAAAAEGSFAGQGIPEGGFGEPGAGQAGFGAAGVREAEEELSLELSGAPQAAGPGRFSLPLTIRSGSRSKSVVLSIDVSIEEQ